MAARKLQVEIEKTLKKVVEGVDTFEEAFAKIGAVQGTAKEKLESDLKGQIKKLQKVREQIKTWQTNADIKDKSALDHHRRLIETQMEKFKVAEREMKTKAFSREGLLQSTKLDPAQRAKADLVSWISNQVDLLNQQIEIAEAELEGLAAKKKKDVNKSELQEWNTRRAWHVRRLETVMRLLENGDLDIERVNTIKDDISYFVESHLDEGFVEDEAIYDELELGDNGDGDAERESREVSKEPALKGDRKEDKKDDKREDKKEDKGDKGDTKIDVKVETKIETKIDKESKDTKTQVLRGASVVVPMPKAAAAPVLMPAVKYAAVATGGVAAGQVGQSQAVLNQVGLSHVGLNQVNQVASTQVGSSQGPAQGPSSTQGQVHASLQTSNSAPVQPTLPSQVNPNTSKREEKNKVGPSTTASEERSPRKKRETDARSTVSPTRQTPPTAPAAQMLSPPVEASALTSPVNVTSNLAPEPRAQSANLAQLNQILAHAATVIQEPADSEKPRFYVPKNPHATPNYYPQVPSKALDNPMLYAHFELDTLFYIFYYMQGTYQQYLAAKELKRQSWRFHKQYLTWFQRHAEPQTITDQYEQGVYVYFDWEGTWSQRKKRDFKFEYCHLEDAKEDF